MFQACSNCYKLSRSPCLYCTIKKKKKLLKDLPCKLPDAIQPETASTVQTLWETFHEIYSIITNKTLLEDDMDSYFENAKNWVNLFTSLCDKKIKQM